MNYARELALKNYSGISDYLSDKKTLTTEEESILKRCKLMTLNITPLTIGGVTTYWVGNEEISESDAMHRLDTGKKRRSTKRKKGGTRNTIKSQVMAFLEENGPDADFGNQWPEKDEDTLNKYRKEFKKEKGLIKTRKRNPKLYPNIIKFLDTNGHDADMSKEFKNVLPATLEAYRSKYRKEKGIKVKRDTSHLKGRKKGSGLQSKVSAYLEEHGHDAELTVAFPEAKKATLEVYRSMFRKEKGIKVKRGRK